MTRIAAPEAGEKPPSFFSESGALMRGHEMRDWVILVEKAKRGDQRAFDTLVVKFKDMAIGYAYSLLKDFHLAEDAAQEAFIRAFHDLPSLKAPLAFPSWFRRLVFKFSDRIIRRKRHSTIAIDQISEHPVASEQPAHFMEREEEREHVLACIRALPEGERTVTTLFYIDGYSMAEVGSFLGVPLTTVKSRLFSAKKRLKKRMVAMIKDLLGEHTRDERFNARIRKVLGRVPVVDFELYRRKDKGGIPRCPESVPFPSCLRAYLEYIGQGYEPEIINAHGRKWRMDSSYAMAMGTSGAAFKLNWIAGWHPEITAVFCPGGDPWAAQKRALDAMGIPHEIIQNNGRNRESFVKKIRQSIQQEGRPCIAKGVLGPPEECLITGFDKSGDVLIGWSFFQRQKEFLDDVEFEANGYFRKTKWYANTPGVIIAGRRKEEGDLKAVYRMALEWAVLMMETEKSGEGVPSGISAYQTWIDTISDDAQFTDRKVKDLVSQYRIHHANVGLLAECRWYGHLFLQRMLAQAGFPESLKHASGCFQDIHDTMWKVWNAVGGIGVNPNKARQFAEHETRRKIVDLLRHARELDVKALGYIKGALRAIS
jgi:RNA polymerase sigma factor (sigma-70 family)